MAHGTKEAPKKHDDEAPSVEEFAARFVKKKEEIEVDKYFRALVKLQGSDLHMKVGKPPCVRVRNELKPLNRGPIDSEEMVRLRSHLSQFQEALDAPGEAGKMLDFLLQELNREANTTLSKSTDLAIKEAGLAIKAEVEKLREQVQNVE